MLYSQTQVFQISWLLKQFFNLNLTFYKLTKSQQLHKMVFNHKVAESTENRFYYYFSVNSVALRLYIL